MRRFLAVAMVLLLLAPSVALADEVVTAKGVSFFESGREAIAREKALDDAKRAAVEKAVGTRIESRTVVENFEVSRDQILSHAAGYLKDLQIIKEGKTDLGTYEVEIQAHVEIPALVSDLDRFHEILGWQKNPRVAVTLSPGIDPSVVPAARKTASRLAGRMKSEGFRIFDAKAAASMHMGLIVQIGLQISDSQTQYEGIQLSLHEVSLTANVLRPGEGEVLATASAVKSLPGVNRLAVLDKGAAQCEETVWQNLRRQLTRQWETELFSQRQIDLVIHNVDTQAQAEEIAADIKSDVSNVADISVIDFVKGTAEFSMQYKGWPEYLVTELQMSYFTNKYFASTLDQVTGNKVVLTIQKGSTGGQ